MRCDFCDEQMEQDEIGLFLVDEQRGGHIECGWKRLKELQHTTPFKGKKPKAAVADDLDFWPFWR